MAYAITIGGSGQRFDCAEGHNVLQGMMRRGRNGIPVGCRGGGCGVCKVRVLEGRYSTGAMSSACVSHEERETGMALACKLVPETDLRLDVVGKIARLLERHSDPFHFYSGAVGAAKNYSKED
jgi:ferredoxin